MLSCWNYVVNGYCLDATGFSPSALRGWQTEVTCAFFKLVYDPETLVYDSHGQCEWSLFVSCVIIMHVEATRNAVHWLRIHRCLSTGWRMAHLPQRPQRPQRSWSWAHGQSKLHISVLRLALPVKLDPWVPWILQEPSRRTRWLAHRD